MSKRCSDHVFRQLGGRFTREQADEIVKRLEAKAIRAIEAGEAKTEKLWQKLADEATADEIIAEAAERRMRLHAAKARARRHVFYERHLAEGGDEAQALRVLNVGEEKQGFSRGSSVDAQGRAMTVRLWGGLERELAEANLLSRLADPWKPADEAFELAVATELSIRRGGKDAPTGDAEAAKAAEIIGNYLDEGRRLQNNEGAFIAELEGHIVRQSHDPMKVGGGFWKGVSVRADAKTITARQEANFKRWRAAIKPKLDARTFDGVKNRDEFLKEVWLDIVTGRHERHLGADDVEGWRPPASKARSVSARRVLHFKSAGDWYGYNREFGQGNLMQAVARDLERAARNAALMRVWGPSPEAAFAADIDRLAAQGRGRDWTIEKRLRANVRRWEFDEVSGLANVPANLRAATVGRWFRLDQVLSKLGGMMLSSFSDTPLAAATLHRAGASMFDSYGAAFGGITRLQGAAQREAADLLGVGARSVIGDITTRYSATDGAYGVAAYAQNFFYRVNGFRLWSDGLRRGVGAMLSRHLGMQAEKGWGALDAATRGQLERYGIEARQWEQVRRHVSTIGEERFLFSEAADALDDAAVRDAMGLKRDAPARAVAAAREELKTRLGAYFIDQAENALTEGRARERSRMMLGSKPGTVWGEAVRAFMQFLTFPTSVVQRHVRPALRGHEGRGRAATLAHLMVMTTLFGYVSMQSKQIAKGLTPRPLTDDDGNIRMDVVSAAFLQGGGLGIFGDFLFGEYNRFGGGFIATAGGPLLGEIEQFHKLLMTLRDDPEDAGAEAIRLGLRNTPLINLFYTRAAMDYLFIYHLQEWASPGYLRRYERRVERERGQEFLIRPSEVVE